MMQTVQANPDEIIGEDEIKTRLDFGQSIHEDMDEDKKSEDEEPAKKEGSADKN